MDDAKVNLTSDCYLRLVDIDSRLADARYLPYRDKRRLSQHNPFEKVEAEMRRSASATVTVSVGGWAQSLVDKGFPLTCRLNMNMVCVDNIV